MCIYTYGYLCMEAHMYTLQCIYVYYIYLSREGVAPSPTHWCSSYRKGRLRVTLDYGR